VQEDEVYREEPMNLSLLSIYHKYKAISI
jgi:hypothetical protein